LPKLFDLSTAFHVHSEVEGKFWHRLSTKDINPDIFVQLKNPPDKIMKPEKEDISGITWTYGYPRVTKGKSGILLIKHAHTLELNHLKHTRT